jgi:hypothetical protein
VFTPPAPQLDAATLAALQALALKAVKLDEHGASGDSSSAEGAGHRHSSMSAPAHGDMLSSKTTLTEHSSSVGQPTSLGAGTAADSLRSIVGKPSPTAEGGSGWVSRAATSEAEPVAAGAQLSMGASTSGELQGPVHTSHLLSQIFSGTDASEGTLRSQEDDAQWRDSYDLSDASVREGPFALPCTVQCLCISGLCCRGCNSVAAA